MDGHIPVPQMRWSVFLVGVLDEGHRRHKIPAPVQLPFCGEDQTFRVITHKAGRVLGWEGLPFTLGHSFFFFFNKLIYYLFLAVLGLRCCTRAFSSCGEWGLLFVVVCWLLIAVASLVSEH